MNHGRDDKERYARIREIERLRAINQSPWAIGVSHWNQRDLYTTSSRIEDDGYARGPATHPVEGSYAYHREVHPQDIGPRGPKENRATLPEREAWPWLNYTTAKDDPYFAHLDHAKRHDSFWERLKDGVGEFFHLESPPHGGKASKNGERLDSRIMEDVCDALTYRGDLDATDIDVTVHAGEVTLEGTVADRRSKHIAEEVSEGVLGVKDVHNKLTLRKDDPTDANVAFVLPLAMFGV